MSDITLFREFYKRFALRIAMQLHHYDREEKRRRMAGETRLGRAINLFRIRHL